MISKICPTWCTAVHMWQRYSNKAWNSRHPWYLVMGFCSQDISEFSVMPNAARGESYSFIPCRMVHLRHFESLELWEPWNLFKEWPPRATLDALGYVHTVPDRFLFHFKSCSGTVWTRINVLLRCRNCSKAFPVWTEAVSVIQFATLPFDLKDHLPKRGFIAISAPIKVFRLDSDRFKNLSDTKRSTFNIRVEQHCSGAENALKAAFLVWTEAISSTLSAMLRFTIRYCANIASDMRCC